MFAVLAVVDPPCSSLDFDVVADAAVVEAADVVPVADFLLVDLEAGTVDCADDLAALDVVSDVALVTPNSASANLTLPRCFC